ncbi:hypothetical protein TI03_05275, partial [Achromatium sp. WMS1]
MLALTLLPNYIEKLETLESEDLPSLLLKTINDLRQSRGDLPIEEADLVLADIAQNTAKQQTGNITDDKLQPFVLKIRPKLHKGLLDWISDTNSTSGIQILKDIFGDLATYTKGAPLLHGIFKTTQAISVGLIEGSITASKQIKVLFGRIERIVKELGEQGLKTTIKNVLLPEHFQDALRVIAKSQSDNTLIAAIRDEYGLNNIFPTSTTPTDEENWLLSPSTNSSLELRASAMKELLPIKDTLDLFIGGRIQTAQIKELFEPIQHLANTLEKLGLQDSGQRLHARSRDLESIGDRDDSIDDKLLMNLASDLLHVETSLSDSNKKQSARQTGSLLSQGEMRSVEVRVLHEAILDMEKAKEAIIAYIGDPTNLRQLEPT